MSKYAYTQGGILAAVLLAGAAHAVVLNPQGTGQVLIYPYYNAAAGNTTLLTVTNHTDRGKVVRLRWAEGEGGRDALTFHVFLSAYDSWTGGVFADAQGRTSLTTDDSSCTYPPIVRSSGLPQLPDGRRYVRFFLDAPSGPGSPEPERTREGYVEAIEVATLVAGSRTDDAIGASAGERDCAVIEAAWTWPGGYWLSDPKQDLANPTGGLNGYAAVVNVAAGTIFGTPALALEDFRVDPLDQPRGSTASVVVHDGYQTRNARPNLADALSDPAVQTARATVLVDGRMVSATYPASQAIDAVSAVLVAARLSGDFDTTAAVGATTSFVLTFPTKRFYTDPELLGQSAYNGVAPFRRAFHGPLPLGTVDGWHLLLTDRDAGIVADTYGMHFNGCATDVRHPDTMLVVAAPGNVPDPLLATRVHADMGNHCGIAHPPGAYHDRGSGSLLLLLDRQSWDTPVELRPSLEGYRFLGLPVLGTRLINYINSNVQNSTMANYSTAAPMTWSARCAKADGTACAP